MKTNRRTTVAAAFASAEDARRATRALKEAGFPEDQIGVASTNRDNAELTEETEGATHAGEGALAGAAAGAGVGALWGLGILAGVLPAIGPAIAGGTLAVILSSAAAGAAAAGLAGALIGMGFTKDEAEFYEGEMKAGRTIVTVDAGSRRDEAVRLLRNFGGYDFDQREPGSRTATTSGRASDAAGVACSTTDTPGQQTIRAHEEKLDIHKEPVETGEVRVRKEVHTEHKTIDVPVTREEVVVERHPTSGRAASTSELGKNQEIRVPVHEEQVKVDKRTVVGEEVTVGKQVLHDTKRVEEDIRKEHIDMKSTGDAKVRDH